MAKPKVVILMFSSGKLVITGEREPKDIVNAVDEVVRELKNSSLMTT